jgi:beta-lactamase class A
MVGPIFESTSALGFQLDFGSKRFDPGLCEKIDRVKPSVMNFHGPAGAMIVLIALGAMGCATISSGVNRKFDNYTLDFTSPVNPALQAKLEKIDAGLREKFGLTQDQAAVGVLDLNTLRLAIIHPDRGEYAASVPKIGILLAYFQRHPEAATNLSATTRHELGLMAKASNNEMATKFSRELGLKEIQAVLDAGHFYDTNHGGGIWMGKHYGAGDERYGDPIGNNSHAATVRQLLRYFLLLEQGKLVSPPASKVMREIFASPDIPHDDIKFVKGLAGRSVQIIRKWGTWQDWRHDSAVVTGGGRHYIIVALTRHARGDEYLVDFARAVDDLMIEAAPL